MKILAINKYLIVKEDDSVTKSSSRIVVTSDDSAFKKGTVLASSSKDDDDNDNIPIGSVIVYIANAASELGLGHDEGVVVLAMENVVGVIKDD